MPEVPLGTSSQNRRTAWMPIVRVVNMLVEKDVSNQFKGVSHIQRPGLTAFATVGDGPVRGLFRQAGTFGGDFLDVSGDEWYRVDDTGSETLLGAVPGSLRTSTAATQTRAITVSDGIAYSTNGTTVTTVVMPDGRLVGSIAQLNGYFILTELDSARFYWIEPGQTNPDGLSFATTESSPGDNIKVERVGDELWFLKEEGVEVWTPTGDPDLPFQRTPGRNYDKGCRARDTVCRFDNSLAWVGNDGIVYRGDNAPVRISDHALEEQIRKASPDSLSAWSPTFDGHTLYVLRMDVGTYAFDASSGQWSEFQSYDGEPWRVTTGEAGETFTVCGDSQSGALYILDPQATTDAGDPITRTLTGGTTVVGQPQRCDSFSLYAVTGTATDPNLYPKARVEWSDNLETYGDFVDVSIGRTGSYNEPVRINRLGVMRYPGRMWRITVTDPVVLTVRAAAYNEPSR